MSNNILFILMTLTSLSFVLIAFRLGRVWLISLIAVNVVIMNIFVIKGMYLFGLAGTGGNVLYASIFLATDILSEHYGKQEAMKAVRVGFFVSIFFLVMSQFIILFKPADYDIAQSSLLTLFTLTPRIVLGSMMAYLVSQHIDVWLFDKIKSKTQGKHLWLRNNGSTFVSQFIDSVIFTSIAFIGIYPIIPLIFFTYLIKLVVAVIDTPFMYLSKKIKHGN
ncbi:queuosine precursor transporter [bacterium]|jgi:queuosine precursor transporter|nr:queuosine precursor transporter [bacterium]MBT4121401.1 queuosine precursor transporter [bacterium]MBT4335543.1 queuosine precursor transporter [bacterium]MBT4495300.1 queuosine precursor transporter [bacterium]MBT4763669.1 queuosine precursor transporter [bacterium]